MGPLGGCSVDSASVGWLHIRSRCYISRSRGLRRYVFCEQRVISSSMLTIPIQNSISTPQTTALFAPNMAILAYPTKTLAWTRLASSLASSP
jgi:hypothetical protein